MTHCFGRNPSRLATQAGPRGFQCRGFNACMEADAPWSVFRSYVRSVIDRLRVRQLATCTVSILLFAQTVSAQTGIGVQVPEGFSVTLYADDELAHDIYSMTIDSFGRVVVSGRGYVKILIDSDGDGRADAAKQFADGPATGAQGMFFLGRDLLCVGDGGLIRYRDRDGDDRADGAPDQFLKLKTGGEHHVHSVQKGPDGWWYLIAGNYADITSRYATLPTSPVKRPLAGTIFRLKPDLGGGEIVGHGLRNAYDFAFNSSGDVFTFDSDGERDVSLPWYRPTRVFQVVPGSHAGWVTRSWKQPDYFADMPPVLAEFGRGSPTGVTCYRHWQFPEEYHDSLFALDWSYGRVVNLKLQRDGASYKATPSTFMSGVGQFGFAPTDCDVGPDGSLFVCVGGRGTRGSVYRVWKQNGDRAPWPGKPATTEAQTFACLTAPMPLSSWSRANWERLAKTAGRDAFVEAALDSSQSESRRVRAIEILTELFDGLDVKAAETLASDKSPRVRARVAWSIGRSAQPAEIKERMLPFLSDKDSIVGRAASEALLGLPGALDGEELTVALVGRLAGPSRYDRMAAARLLPQLSDAAFAGISVRATGLGPQADVSAAFGRLGRSSGFDAFSFEVGLRILEGKSPAELKLEAVRLMQLGLGDLSPKGKAVPAFDGYAAGLDLTEAERTLDPYRIRLAGLFPTGHDRVDYELARLLAMLQPFNADLLSRVLTMITDETHPTDDLHYLVVAARIPALRDSEHRDVTAKALVSLEPKLRSRNLHQDSNWEPRIDELYKALIKLDRFLPAAVIKQESFGSPGHVVFMSQFPKELLETAIDAFVMKIKNDDEYLWSNDVVFLLEESRLPEHRQLVREQFENFSVRGAVTVVLSKTPEPQDRSIFVAGLDSSQNEVLTASVNALEKLPAARHGAERVSLVHCLRRLGVEKNELPIRERIVKLLRKSSNKEFGFVFGEKGNGPQLDVVKSWTEWVVEIHPKDAARLTGSGNADVAALNAALESADWDAGDKARGRRFFEKRACAQCHGGSRALGPDLAGVAGRFSRKDVFTSIADPNRDVSSRYQTTMIITNEGKTYSGLIIYESIDGLILRNSTNQTFRISSSEIDVRRTLPKSLMPIGLLKNAKPDELADLYAYLKSLGQKQ